MNEEKKTSPGHSKLSTIFLVVLGLHVVVIVLILAYNLLKGDTEVEEGPYFGSAQPTAPYTRPAPAEVRPEPRLETGQTEAAEPVEPDIQTAAQPMSMPSSRDPIWAMGNIEPRAPQAPEPAPLEQASLSEQAEQIRRETESALVPAAPVTPSSAATAATTYQVVKGDSLSRIGNRFGVSVDRLRQANGIEGSLIRVGQVLTIPAGGSAAPRMAAATPASVTPVDAPATAVSHVVQKGDTLWNIARKYQVKPNELASHNGINDPRQLKVGTRLNIPGAQQMARPVQQSTPRVENTDMAMKAE